MNTVDHLPRKMHAYAYHPESYTHARVFIETLRLSFQGIPSEEPERA